MKIIRLKAGIEYVQCSELPELIAYALWPDDGTDNEGWEINHGTCRDDLDRKVRQAAQNGELPLKHPTSFEPVERVSGNAWKSGLVTVDDLRAYVADRGISVLRDTPQQADLKPQTAPLLEAALVVNARDMKPWQIVDPKDPKPEQPWYTPARYFARQLVLKDSTLLTKKLMLADKVSLSLYNAGIYKRGGHKQRLAAETVLKAFSNVALG